MRLHRLGAQEGIGLLKDLEPADPTTPSEVVQGLHYTPECQLTGTDIDNSVPP